MRKRTVLEINPHVFQRGFMAESASPMQLAAGPLLLLFEPHTGFLRRIYLGRREVLRGIYAAVRDANWRTIPPMVHILKQDVREDQFVIAFHSEHREAEIDFRWDGRVEGRPDGTVIYSLDGQAYSTFRKNRIGFCVLHPIRECAGVRTRQVRTGGEIVEGHFPRWIEPQIFGQSPFRDLRALAHEVQPGLWAELTFVGDIFEMEDQRNWTDASFKTYGTPLALPFPVLLQAGTRIPQRVELRLQGDRREMRPAHRRPTHRKLHLDLAGEALDWRPLPVLGLGLATHNEPLREQEVERLRALPLAHVRCDLHLGQPDWPACWGRAVRQARRLNLPLELALHLPRNLDAIPGSFPAKLASSVVALARVLALREGEAATSEASLKAVRQLLGRRAGSTPVGAGTNAHFCELNREQALGKVPWREADFLFWPITPQVHAFDDLSLVETLEVLGDTIATAGAFAPGKPCVVSPVTLKPRFNAVATTEEAATTEPNKLPPNVDPRQCSLLAAGWTLGSLAALMAAGAASITYYETTGWRGVMETISGLPGAVGFPSLAGRVFPMYFIFAALQGSSEGAVPVLSVAGQVTAMALRDRRGRRRLLLANLQGERQTVEFRLPKGLWKIYTLDERNYLRYLRRPAAWRDMAAGECVQQTKFELELGPYVLAALQEVAA